MSPTTFVQTRDTAHSFYAHPMSVIMLIAYNYLPKSYSRSCTNGDIDRNETKRLTPSTYRDKRDKSITSEFRGLVSYGKMYTCRYI